MSSGVVFQDRFYWASLKSQRSVQFHILSSVGFGGIKMSCEHWFIFQDIASKTKELLTNLTSLATPGSAGKPVITLEALRSRKMAPTTENFLFNLAAAEGLLSTWQRGGWKTVNFSTSSTVWCQCWGGGGYLNLTLWCSYSCEGGEDHWDYISLNYLNEFLRCVPCGILVLGVVM